MGRGAPRVGARILEDLDFDPAGRCRGDLPSSAVVALAESEQGPGPVVPRGHLEGAQGSVLPGEEVPAQLVLRLHGRCAAYHAGGQALIHSVRLLALSLSGCEDRVAIFAGEDRSAIS